MLDVQEAGHCCLLSVDTCLLMILVGWTDSLKLVVSSIKYQGCIKMLILCRGDK